VNPLFEAAVEIQAFFAGHGWQHTVIGGLAVQRWGEPRQTRDVDLALLTGIGGEHEYTDTILARFQARRPDARDFALTYRVLLIQSTAGVPLDVSLVALPYEARVMARSSPFAFTPDCVVLTCSAEDLVVLKAFADRPQDWIDVEGVIVRQRGTLDRALVRRELRELLDLKEDFGPEATLTKLFDKHQS
jgi:hypothetical protein